MKKITILIAIVALFAITLNGVNSDYIITKVDSNQLFKTQAFSGKMIIENNNRTLTKQFYGYAVKKGEKSFIKFTNREDYGVKYLRIEDQLWIYFPDADDIMKIAGHMLKQGMMGSDISYEDMLETETISKDYDSSILGEVKIGSHFCYKVKLSSKHSKTKYSSQMMYVEKKTFIPIKIEQYAFGGRLIKIMTQSNIKKIGSRYVPYKAVVTDVRKKNSKTTVMFNKISYDLNIPDKVFSLQYLREK